MALEAQFDAGFGAETRYFRIRSLHVDFDTGAVSQGKLEIYKDAATRAAYKAARKSAAELQTRIALAEAAFRQAVADHKAMPADERAAAEEAHRLDRMTRSQGIEGLKEEHRAYVRDQEANKPGRVADFEVAPGEIEIGPDGQVLGALYILMANRFPEAQEA